MCDIAQRVRHEQSSGMADKNVQRIFNCMKAEDETGGNMVRALKVTEVPYLT